MTISQGQIETMSVEERMQLINLIYETLGGGPPDTLSVTEEQRAELGRRYEECRNDPTPSTTWPKVNAKMPV